MKISHQFAFLKKKMADPSDDSPRIPHEENDCEDVGSSTNQDSDDEFESSKTDPEGFDSSASSISDDAEGEPGDNHTDGGNGSGANVVSKPQQVPETTQYLSENENVCGEDIQGSGVVAVTGGSTSTTQLLANQALEVVQTFAGREQTHFDTTVEQDSQSNLVTVHVQLTQTNIHDATAISLGGPVVVNPSDTTKKSKKRDTTHLRPRSEIQKLRFETRRTIRKWTEGMIKTTVTRNVLEKISQGKTWITITGSPGEGKTTTGYSVLKQLHDMGREVYEIKDPEEYFRIKESKVPVLMFNDIFGSLRFDLLNISKWERVLTDILAMTDHRGQRLDVGGGHQHQLTVILTSRSSILNAARHHLGRFQNLILNDDCVVDLSQGQHIAVEERKEIWKYHSRKYNLDIAEKIVNDVCEMSMGPHGFPHCCSLFAELYSKNKDLSMRDFFSSPMTFLNLTMESLMNDEKTGPVLREMLKHDGCLQLDDDDDKAFQCASVVDTLSDTYLSRNGDTVTFHHPSVYDSAASVVCKTLPSFVIKNCSLSFLNERVRFSGLDLGVQTESQQTVTVDKTYTKTFLDRLRSEFENGNLYLTLSHKSFHDKEFVSQFFRCIFGSIQVQSMPKKLQYMINMKDKRTRKSFLFLMTKSKSDKILKYVCDSAELSDEEQAETLFGICDHSSVAAMKFFLQKYEHFNFNVENAYLQTPLLLASTKGSEELLKLLLDKNVDINTTDVTGYSVLHNVCKYGVNGDGDVVKMLIGKGADPNKECSDDPFYPLHIACYEGHRNVVMALLDCGLDVNSTRICDFSCLYYACRMRHVGLVAELLERGADVNKANSYGSTCLHKASESGCLDIVTILLNGGADVNQTDRYGNAALHGSCNKGHVGVVKTLLENGCDINLADNGGNSPLHLSCYEGHDEIVTVLLEKDANMNCSDKDGDTPLHGACYYGHADVVTILTNKGTDVKKTNKFGNTPLHTACFKGHVDVVNILLDREADINKTNMRGNTPLHGACYYGHLDVVRVLLDRGADGNKTNKSGSTPLHTACYKGHANTVIVLIDGGADENVENTEGATPLSVARENLFWNNVHIERAFAVKRATTN